MASDIQSQKKRVVKQYNKIEKSKFLYCNIAKWLTTKPDIKMNTTSYKTMDDDQT